jgi:hypothetical protein
VIGSRQTYSIFYFLNFLTMKKVFLTKLSVCFALFIASFSCVFAQKGDGVISTGSADKILSQIQYSQMRIEGEMLSFSSEESAKQTIELLESAQNAYLSEIGASFSGLSEEAQDKVVVDDNYVFSQFAKQTRFTNSLRQEIANAEAKLFASGDFELSSMPADKGIPFDFLQAIVNTNGEVKAGKEIHKVFPDGGSVIILDGDLKTLNYLRKFSSSSVIKPTKNVKIVNSVSSKGDGCENYVEKDDKLTKTLGSTDYRAKLETGIYNGLWNHRAWAKVLSQRKGKYNTFWKKFHTFIEINLKGEVWENTNEPALCEDWVYNQVTQQYEFVGYYPCTVSVDCSKQILVNQSTSGYNNDLKTEFSIGDRIGIPEDGVAILCGNYKWFGLTKSVCIPN